MDLLQEYFQLTLCKSMSYPEEDKVLFSMETVLERWARRAEGVSLLCVSGVRPTNLVGRGVNVLSISSHTKLSFHIY